jgi:Heterokaryon incompatibility protein (HET)
MSAFQTTSSRPFYFRSGPFFHHFWELCFTTYPSPLERNAPIRAKLFLLALVGGFEFVAGSWIADLFGAAVGIPYLIIWKSSGDSIFESSRDVGLALVAVISFFLRAKSFVSYASRQGRGLTIQSLSTSFFWHNPVLVYHGAFRLWAYCTGHPPLRLLISRFFWILVAPTLESGLDQLNAADKSSSGSWLSWLWPYVLSGIGIMILRFVVTSGPMFIITFTLAAQSEAAIAESKKKIQRSSKIDTVMSPASLPLYNGKDAVCIPINVSFSGIDHFNAYLRYTLKFVSICIEWFADWLARQILKTRTAATSQNDSRPGLRQFRLLTIYPGFGNMPVRCSRQWHWIGTAQRYKAISYAWGTEKERRISWKIYINGASTEITKASFEVLKAMRSPYKAVTVWIDYICIDQANKLEKDYQIPLMPLIYMHAAEVIVWLGHSKTADIATSLVNRLFLVNRVRKQSGMRFPYAMTV